MIQSFRSAAALLSASRVDRPIVGFRKHVLEARVKSVINQFPGTVMYAVKCNASPVVIETLYQAGLRDFDTASLEEIRLVKSLCPDASCHFMHPIKSREAISEAYFQHGVRRFVVDHVTELEKLIDCTHWAGDLEIFVRLAVPGEGAVLALTGKFGATPAEATTLLRRAKAFSDHVGITFHVGSQMLQPSSFNKAIAIAAEAADLVGGVDSIDIGGGFPAMYRGCEPEFAEFVAAVKEALKEHDLSVTLQCEPGRLLVADGASVLARVEMRRGHSLFINDGVYGNLAELKWVGPQFPTRMIRPGRRPESGATAFDLFGPTCDTIDSMPGPHWLPADIQEGDWIEFGMMGAYSQSLKTGFNGFGETDTVYFEDEAWYCSRLSSLPITANQNKSSAA